MDMSIEALLQTYSFEEILELNDWTTEDCLSFLVSKGLIRLPEIQPLEFEDEAS